MRRCLRLKEMVCTGRKILGQCSQDICDFTLMTQKNTSAVESFLGKPEFQTIAQALDDNKFAIPHVAPDLLLLPRLEDTFDVTALPRLVIFDSAAGYGKTTMLIKLRVNAESKGIRTGWLNLGGEDNSPIRFLQCVTAAVTSRPSAPGIIPFAHLNKSARATTDGMLSTFCRDISQISGQVLLFLDDYHLIDNANVHEVMDWLVFRAPDNLKFIIASRERLPLRLGKFRLAQDIREIHAEQLSLRLEESSAFVNTVSGRHLHPEEMKLLHQRTEGWVAGLQLVSLALRDVDDASNFVSAFSGTDRDITSYLAEIVLSSLSKDLAQFIMRTALLDKFSLVLCRDVLKQENAVEMLKAIRIKNLFLISLDRQDTWFRYHRLFADYLRRCYIASDPAAALEVYATASVWFENDGALNEAIHYAFSAKQYERAANLITRCAHDMVILRGEHAMFLTWIDTLPRHCVAERPQLRLAQISSLLRTHRYSDADQQLCSLEQDIESAHAGGIGPHIDGHMPLKVWARKVELMRLTYLSLTLNTSLAGQRGIEWLAASDQNDRPAEVGNALNVVGYDAFFRHDYNGALQYFVNAKKSYEKANAYYGVAYAETLRCMVELERGNVNVADRILGDADIVIAKELGPDSYGGSVLWVPRVRVSYELNKIQEADQTLDNLFLLMNRRSCGFPFMIKARILSLRNQFDDADAILQHGISHMEEMGVFSMLPILHTERLHLMLKRGLVTQALALAESIDLFDKKSNGRQSVKSSNGDLGLRLSVVRLKLATGQGAVLDLLNGLIAEARRYGRNMWLVKFLCVKAAACIERDQRDEAVRLIYEAMTIGACGGLCRSLVDEGEHVRNLVTEIAGRRGQLKSEPAGLVPTDYLITLQHAFNSGPSMGQQPSDAVAPVVSQKAGLTERELQILRLVDSGLSNRDLATQLYVSEGTIKWHLRNIFGKLDVTNRTSAIGAARALSIL